MSFNSFFLPKEETPWDRHANSESNQWEEEKGEEGGIDNPQRGLVKF